MRKWRWGGNGVAPCARSQAGAWDSRGFPPPASFGSVLGMPEINSPDLSLVIPLFNEEEVFPQLIERVSGLLATLAARGVRAEVIFVDDGSRDATGKMIRRVCEMQPVNGAFRGIRLSRNFGHQLAITAGMRAVSGRAVAILDGDLQDPPEVVVEFYEKLRGNAERGTLNAESKYAYDVVYAVRRERKENVFKRASYAIFYRLMRGLAAIPIPLDSGDFCIMTRRVVEEMNAMPERHRFVRGLRSWVGFRQTGHEYPRAARQAGESKYSFSKLLKLAFDGIFTFSEKPLQWSAVCGLVVAACAVLYAAYVFIWRVFVARDSAPAGFAALAVGLFFLGGVQLISIGILGEYIGRIHNEVKGRPLYVVAEKFGFPAQEH
jgi:polyisoprenyl-phosphate glycosyltransferase